MTELKSCAVCGGEFYKPSLLLYPDSPRSAQGFLDTPDQPDEVANLEILQCRYCGLVQHNLPPVSYYRDVIRAVAFSEAMGKFRIGQLAEWLKRASLQDKRLLEIGCGKGEYMDLLKQAGAEHVHGIENNPISVEVTRKRGLKVEQGYLAAGFTNPWPKKFDGFAIFSFMEHWPDPNGSLRALLNLINEEAIGLIEVPNFEFIIKNGLYSEFTVDHIFYFDRQTLRALLEKNGFEVISVDVIWHDYIISAQVRKRRPQNTSVFLEKQKRIVNQLRKFAGRFIPHDVVVWGAGHQSLAVICLAKLEDMVSHVVDSATFKQGKYTPATRLLIKSPATLLHDRPKAVVVMAAAYSDEVAQMIKRDYPQIEHVAILREDKLEIIKGA